VVAAPKPGHHRPDRQRTAPHTTDPGTARAWLSLRRTGQHVVTSHRSIVKAPSSRG